MKRLLGLMLHTANRHTPFIGDTRRRFYAMKERILMRWGTPDGYDLQRFEAQMCFACDGTGKADWDEDYEEGGCHRCGGTGEWKPARTIGLDRYRLGGYVMHIPRQVPLNKPVFGCKQFSGLLRHTAPQCYLAQECQLWLALLFDRTLFRALFGHSACCGPKRTPLVMLSTWTFNARRFWQATRECVRDEDIPF